MKNFNKLTLGEAERLALLAEEMGEALQIVGKILRHGYESRNPLIEDAENNRSLLEKELGDVFCAMILMSDAHDINKEKLNDRARDKTGKVQKWMHHQPLGMYKTEEPKEEK